MEKKQIQFENTYQKVRKHRTLTPELSTESNNMIKNPSMNLSVFGHTVTKSKNKKNKKT